ncbi:MAG: ABC transporter ATP-binding protein [Halobellus sp.]|uniref:ABC transporter ATP-binding protein n=1 Tax=Halobellus sp. TaxID=1979212 RepID=UPI0035D3FF68
MNLTLENVRKTYGETIALGRSESGQADGETVAFDRSGSGQAGGDANGISLDVDDGEFFTLVGPSGCGKTTTLRLVAGFEPPSDGTIRFDGEQMRGVPPEDRNVGVVFQNYALFPHLSVRENVAYGLKFDDPPGDESDAERVASLLELVDLPDAGDRDPAKLSGGQQQRIALARALAPGPDLLLLDEPMSALDAQLRERLRIQIKEIQSELGITTLYVTHDQEEALAISDRMAVMNDGAVEQVGTPRDVYRRPATRFVANFVGDNNVFEGPVVSVRGGGDPRKTTTSVGDDPESPSETKGSAGGRIIDVDVGGATVAVASGPEVESDDRVVFCVRPEGMSVVGERAERQDLTRDETASRDFDRVGESRTVLDENSTNVLTATVSKAEFLGDSTRSHLRWNGQELTVRSVDPLEGDVRVGFEPSAAHVVEVESRRER